jgi:hypothetical protein
MKAFIVDGYGPSITLRAGQWPDPVIGDGDVRPVLTVLSRTARREARKLGVRYSFVFMRADGGQLQQVTALVEVGVGSGRVKGKVVVTMAPVLEARS